MSPLDDRESEKNFEAAWKRLAAEPPRLSPADAAARVAQRIRAGRRRRPAFWRYAAAAAVLIALFVVAVFEVRQNRAPTPEAPALRENLPLGDGQVLIWLDRDTPLYMTFQHP